MLQDLLPVTGLEIDHVVIAVGLVPGHLLPVGEIGRADGASEIVADIDVRKIGRRELDELPIRQVHHGAVVPRPLVIGAHALHRLDDTASFVDQRSTAIGSGVVAFGSGVGAGGGEVPRNSRAPSRENRGAPFSATTIPFGMPGVDADTSSDAFGSGALPVIEAIRRDRFLELRLVAEECHLLPGIVEGDAPVASLAGVQRRDRAVGEPSHERAVLGRVVGRHRIREQRALLVPDVLGDFGDGDFFARRQVPENEIRARLLAIARVGAAPSLTAAPACWWRTSATPAASARHAPAPPAPPVPL